MPVDTTTPLDDWDSIASPLRMTYRADVCDLGPMNRSFTAYMVCPLFNAAFAMVTFLVGRRCEITSRTTFERSSTLNGNSFPSHRAGSGLTPTTGCPSRYFNVLATRPSWPN